MSRIVIKKRITLEFIDEKYKDCYLEFKTIPMKDYGKYVDMATGEKETKAVDFITNTLTDLFVAGKFLGEDGELFDVKKEELGEFDINTTIAVFKILTGQDLSPN